MFLLHSFVLCWWCIVPAHKGQTYSFLIHYFNTYATPNIPVTSEALVLEYACKQFSRNRVNCAKRHYGRSNTLEIEANGVWTQSTYMGGACCPCLQSTPQHEVMNDMLHYARIPPKVRRNYLKWTFCIFMYQKAWLLKFQAQIMSAVPSIQLTVCASFTISPN